ncbi:STAS domain-containing protein [Inquilinus limosus]|uniref:SulP family inorganic anion transporter n=1 Tax=Inquilinus limosus TaxID=171674 RepID=UPI003F146A9C
MTRFLPTALARDLPASIVVFLVALPLCMGIAVASGVPAEKGLMTGIIGGIVVGLLAGSPLQVSGPAAGLAVIVFQLVQDFGLAMLGPILVLAGLLQLGAGLLRLGRWFRAISPAVVHGMLAGIGVLIVAAQVHVLFGRSPLPDGLQNLTAIPAALAGLVPLQWSSGSAAVLAGGATILAMVLWEKLRPRSLRLVPGALVGVAAGTILAVALALPVQRVEVPDAILASVSVPTMADLSRLGETGILLAALVIAVIASAETLLSAAAVDRMHDGVRTNYDRELSAQGVGNLLCGLAGALPMTGVIVRSSANVQAGARTRWSTIMHGTWLLAAVAMLPWLLREVPMASLAGVLVVTGWRLVSLKHVRELLHRHGVLPAAIWAATVVMVVATDLLTGVLVGLGLSLLEVVPHLRRLPLRIGRRDLPSGETELRLEGAATFLQLPVLLRTLEALPAGATVRVDAGRLAHIDHTSMETIADWAERWTASGARVELHEPSAQPHGQRLAAALGTP